MATCPQPDVPANGKYVPKKRKFEPGDEVNYSCKKEFALFGKDRRVCQSNGVWKDYTPFCDQSIQLTNPSVTNKDDGLDGFSMVSRVVDGNSSTCFDWRNTTGQYLYVKFNDRMAVGMVNMYIRKDITEIQILAGFDNDMNSCGYYNNYIETDRWITVRCRNNLLANTVKISVTNRRPISVCEIKVFGKEEDSCDRPPTGVVPNGHFEVSRSKATLICEEGYRSENDRLVCEGNSTWTGANLKCDEILCDPILPSGLSGGEWTFPGTTKKLSAGTRSELICIKGYQKKGAPHTIFCQQNGTWTKTNATCEEEENSKSNTRTIIFGSVGVVVVILIISLLSVLIHFVRKQRKKEVVVVFQPQSDGSVPLSASEMEYSTPRYEPLPPKVPEPPSTLRPNATSLENTLWMNTLKNKPLPPREVLGTMKASTIYGS